jgi:hypothetical protein
MESVPELGVFERPVNFFMQEDPNLKAINPKEQALLKEVITFTRFYRGNLIEFVDKQQAVNIIKDQK